MFLDGLLIGIGLSYVDQFLAILSGGLLGVEQWVLDCWVGQRRLHSAIAGNTSLEDLVYQRGNRSGSCVLSAGC